MQNRPYSSLKLFGIFILCYSAQTNLYAAEKTTATDSINNYPIAGAMPEQRPSGAPVLKRVMKNDAWYQNALKGIEYPQTEGSVRLFNLLLQQGNWYSPFVHPGMVGKYDIRNMHQQQIVPSETVKTIEEVTVELDDGKTVNK